MRRVAIIGVLAISAAILWPIAAMSTSHDFFLPWDSGEQRVVNCGNDDTENNCKHSGVDEHAWDFDGDNWLVRAARTGTVVDLRDSFGVGADDITYTNKANFVRLLHSDGTETLYTHLKKDSVAAVGLVLGQKVVRHSIIGRTDTSGRSSGPHLHYQAQEHCEVQPDNPSGFCDSVPSSFADPGAGIPTQGETETSANLYDFEPNPPWTPQGWAPYIGLDKPTSGNLTSGTDASSWEEGRVDLFVRGATFMLEHRTRTPTQGWVAWDGTPLGAPPGKTLVGGPTAVSWGPNRIDVLARASDNELWWKPYNNGWAGWAPLDSPEGLTLTSDPDVASWEPNRLDVFARSSDNQLWHRAWTGSQWAAWEPLGGFLTSGPSAISWSPGRIDVFVRGVSPQNHLYHRVYILGSGWFAWENLCSGQYPNCALTSGPDAASWVANRIDVFVRGASNHLYHRVWAGGPQWVNFANLCAAPHPTCVLSDDPGAVAWGYGRIDVFHRNGNNAIHRRYGL